MMSTEFLHDVIDAIDREGHAVELTDNEYQVVLMAQAHGVGPSDCAAQIIANRIDDYEAAAAVAAEQWAERALSPGYAS